MFYTADGRLLNKNKKKEISKKEKQIEHFDDDKLCLSNECISKNDILLMKNINELSLYSLLNKNKIDDLSKSQIDKVISGHTIPPDIKVNLLNIKEVSAYGKLDGEINILVSGGYEPYNFKWSNDQVVKNLSGIAAGEYTITVTDAENNIISETYEAPYFAENQQLSPALFAYTLK